MLLISPQEHHAIVGGTFAIHGAGGPWLFFFFLKITHKWLTRSLKCMNREEAKRAKGWKEQMCPLLKSTGCSTLDRKSERLVFNKWGCLGRWWKLGRRNLVREGRLWESGLDVYIVRFLVPSPSSQWEKCEEVMNPSWMLQSVFSTCWTYDLKPYAEK